MRLIGVEEISPEIGGRYRSLVLNAPELIHQCGLLQTLAFHLSKAGNDEHNYNEHKYFLIAYFELACPSKQI